VAKFDDDRCISAKRVREAKLKGADAHCKALRSAK
jgi:hypothetical protein